MTLPAAARAALSLKCGRNRIRDLAGQVGGHRRHGRVTWRGSHGSIDEMAELVLRGPAERTRRCGAACTTRGAGNNRAVSTATVSSFLNAAGRLGG